MGKLNKITWIKFSAFIIYGLTLFTPIYSTEIWGTTFKTSISKLGAGAFFVVIYTVLIVCTIVSKFLLEKYYRYVYLSTVGFMFLLLLLLLLFKESSSLRLTWFLHTIIILILILSHFKEKLTLEIFEKIVIFIKNTFKKVVNFLKEKISKDDVTINESEVGENKE